MSQPINVFRKPDQSDIQQEIARLKTSPAYLRLRAKHLHEFRRTNDEWRTAKPDQVAALQARSLALQEVLDLPNALYREAGGEGTLFEPVVKRYDETE